MKSMEEHKYETLTTFWWDK